jgi:hypothetical protein
MGVEWLPLSVAIEQARASSWTEAQRVCSLSDAVDCEWRGIGIGEHVRTSLLRFYLTAELTDNESSRMVAQKYVDAGVEVAAAADYLLDEHRPECVVAHHGIYLVGGVFLEVARARDVRVAAYDGTYRSNCIVISHGDTYHHELRSEPTTFWEDRELDPFQEQRLDEYTRARRSGAAPQDHITYHPNPVNDLEKVQDALCLDPERLTVALFTNVAWDGQVHVPDAIFSGPLDWLRESLRVLAEEPEYNVVIRVHPAEVKNADWVSQQRADDEVKQWYPELPTHFRLIEAESDLNSYAVARLAVGAAVYSTKIGLELLLMGLPVLVAGDAFYGGKGLAIEPSSRLEYDTELRELGRQSPLPPEQLMRVRRYAYHYYFRRALGVPSFSDSGSGPRLRSLGELAPGKYPDLDVVARGLLTGSPFVSDQC